jgi:hypothetical protein
VITLTTLIVNDLGLQPLRAVNTDGKWRVIVNGVKYNYETLTQTARIEECTTAGSACPLVPPCYETKCLQKNIYHRLHSFFSRECKHEFIYEQIKFINKMGQKCFYKICNYLCTFVTYTVIHCLPFDFLL